MAILDGIKRQLRSVIQWENPGAGALFQRWTDNGDEIKNASKLIVGPGQGCIFVYEGEVKAVLDSECMVELETANIPFWTTVIKAMQFFESEHKVGIYFFRKTKILDQKWGTTSVIKYEDPKYHFPVGLRAYGNYSFRITDPENFFVNVVGGADAYSIQEFRNVMIDRIVHPFSDYFAEASCSYAEIDAKREELTVGIMEKLSGDFGKLGFEITDFRIEGTNFDDETMGRINRIADMSAEAQAAATVGLDYKELQELEALREAARNEGGAAGIGMGMGAGVGFGQMMADRMAGEERKGGAPDPLDNLKKLKVMLEEELITEEEYEAKKKEILASI